MRAADKTCLRLFFIHDICSGNFITNQKKKGENVMSKMKRVIIRVLKCLICLLTGGFRNKGNGGENETC